MKKFANWFWYKARLRVKIMLCVAILFGWGYGFLGCYAYSIGKEIIVQVTEGYSPAERAALIQRFTPAVVSCIVLSVVFYVISLAAAYNLTGKVSERLKNLARQADAIATGDLEGIPQTDASDEIGVVTNNISIMAEKLKEAAEKKVIAETSAENASAMIGALASKKEAPVKKKGKPGDVINGAKILLAEDSPLNTQIVKNLLEERGATVDAAENGKLAAELFEASEDFEYDIILMDARMPVMDGIEATKRIRNGKRSDSLLIPIVALAANAYEEDVKILLEAGMDECLPKPIDVDRLFEIITDQKKLYDLKRNNLSA
jgi:CheY-like chemotaxis protein/HAMP domain-containing protein